MKARALATPATIPSFTNLWEQINAEARTAAGKELAEEETRQGTASAVPKRSGKESGFSR